MVKYAIKQIDEQTGGHTDDVASKNLICVLLYELYLLVTPTASNLDARLTNLTKPLRWISSMFHGRGRRKLTLHPGSSSLASWRQRGSFRPCT